MTTATMAVTETDELTARTRATWMAGDFQKIAEAYAPGVADFIARLNLPPGQRVLDVACGSGNLTIPAARAGAQVTGIDIAPNLCLSRTITFNFPFDPAATVEYFRTYYGPTLRAFATLNPEAQHALRRDLEDLWTQHNRAQDGTTQVDSTYLEVVAVRA